MRVIVLEALQKVSRKISLNSFWHQELSRIPLIERPLANELLLGVLRTRGCLDRVISQLTGNRKCSLWLANILRLGLYQLHFNNKITDYAAIDQSVRLARHYQPKAAPLVNAVLRRFVREADSPAGGWGDLPVIPDRKEDFVDFLAVNYSHPRWLVKRWLKRFGSFQTERLCRANQEEQEVTIRLNRLQLKQPEENKALLERLSERGYEPVDLKTPMEAIKLKHGAGLAATDMYLKGWFEIQAIPSMLSCLALAPRPGERVLDLCAGRGGKTWYLAQLMQNQGELYPWDISWLKLDQLRCNYQRAGVTNLRLVDSQVEFPQRFDRVLVDAPCSSLGILGKEPDIRWTKKPEDITRSSETQLELLGEAVERLRPGGTCLYSVCSFEPEENEDVINHILKTRPDIKRENLKSRLPKGYQNLVDDDGFFRSLPHKSGLDGFFMALLTRTGGKNEKRNNSY
ncbi:MAG: 16S rRNA (cytosine(967)-C(5))-methyltransferase RsmB [bacterium]